MSIEVKKISYTYTEKIQVTAAALSEVSFRIGDGEFVGIMGHTGSGKSTLLQLLAGLLTPSEGRILIDGVDYNAPHNDRAELHRTVGMVFQYPEYQLFETTVERDVAFALKHSGLDRTEIAERVKWALEVMGFSYEDIRKKSPLSLSGGEKRRVAIAGVLAVRPGILMFDEPIAGLDPHGRVAFLELMKQLKNIGTTILIVSHNTDYLCEYADRMLVFNQGKLVADGSPDAIYQDSEWTKRQHIGVSNVRSIAQSLYERGVLASPVITKYATLAEELKSSLKAGEQ